MERFDLIGYTSLDFAGEEGNDYLIDFLLDFYTESISGGYVINYFYGEHGISYY